MGLAKTKEMEEMLRLFRRQYNSVFASKPALLRVCEDSDDDKFIEAAVALDAEYVITGDQHLKILKKYAGIAIVSPRQFIEEHGGQ
jgi:hypothetical protein